MKTSLLVKLNFLVLGMGLTLYFIYLLNSRGLPPGVLAAFGLKPVPANAEQTVTWDWCETRVASLIRPDEFKLSQQGSTWVLEDQAKTVVNFIAVEKWFARYCKLGVQKPEQLPTEGFAPALVVKFVNGQVEMLKRHPSGLFQWRNFVFKSSDFDAALAELSNLR